VKKRRFKDAGTDFIMFRSPVAILIIIWLLAGCTNSHREAKNDAAYISSIEHWQQLRIDSLKGHTGFLNLAGLFWLDSEISTIGADSSKTIVFPEPAAKDLGKVWMKNDSIWFIQPESGRVKIEGGIDSDTTLIYVDGSVGLTMRSGDLNWFIIKRGVTYGIRLRDFNHPLVTSFNHIENYPIDEKWKVKATWEEYPQPKTVTIHNQVGMDLEQPVPGVLHFKLDGEDYSLEPVGSAEHETYFVMIYDKTSGHETYGSGRYIDVPVADENGITYIDFNKAYNPPCAYTDYATCLFPHAANRLPLKVEAGEKYSGSH
jgi:uncharacterized protein